MVGNLKNFPMFFKFPMIAADPYNAMNALIEPKTITDDEDKPV